MGMYPIEASGLFAQDGGFWEFLAYCAGTGGSVLIIGSAAGVAVMGILKIDSDILFLYFCASLTYLVGLIGHSFLFLLIIGMKQNKFQYTFDILALHTKYLFSKNFKLTFSYCH